MKLTYKDLEFDTLTFRLKKNGRPVQLTFIEARLLMTFMSGPGKVFSKADLCQLLDGPANENALMVHISHLREKVEKDPKNPEYIRNVRRTGYCFGEEPASYGDVHEWIVAMSGSDQDDAEAEHVVGTEDDVKRYLLTKVNEAVDTYCQEDGMTREEFFDKYFATETVDEITENRYGRLYAFACFDDSHNDYTAEIYDGKVKYLR